MLLSKFYLTIWIIDITSKKLASSPLTRRAIFPYVQLLLLSWTELQLNFVISRGQAGSTILNRHKTFKDRFLRHAFFLQKILTFLEIEINLPNSMSIY